jgi:DeoR family transcriptional regulator, myo-inositol catabolism operon repressor
MRIITCFSCLKVLLLYEIKLRIKNMKKIQRIQKILEILQERHSCSIDELRKAVNTSSATIHRDVNELADRNLLNRVHGGVEQPDPSATLEESVNIRHMLRLSKNRLGKENIAKIAVRLVEDDDIIFVDSSTSVYYFVKKIIELQNNFSNLTIVTNSGAIIRELTAPPPSFTLIALGGVYHHMLNSFLGKIAVNAIKQLNIKKAFISAAAVTPNEVFTFHESHAEFLKNVLEHSKQSYLLADHLKFETCAAFPICNSSEFDRIISDPQLPSKTRSKYLSAGVNLNV